MAKSKSNLEVGRRKFLSRVAVAGAASAIPAVSQATTPVVKPATALPPSAAQMTAEFGAPSDQLAEATPKVVGQACYASDFMVDVLKTLNIDHVFSNPGSSFLGLHESIVNYGGNTKPDFITAMHEESAAAMANGYYKAAGKPAATLAHSTVGLQHAAMGIYNAWCDRVPMINMLGNTLDLTKRAGGNDWRHSAQDPVGMVRDFIKWDDQPTTLQGFAESMVHGYKIAMTPPMEPIAIVVDSELQEEVHADRSTLVIPKYTPSVPPAGEAGAVKETARLLVQAERPVIIVDRMARSENGMKLMIELAELLTCPVLDLNSRQNLPNMHFLNQNGQRGPLISNADVVLGIEVTDFWGQVNQFARGETLGRRRVKADAKLITIGVADVYMKSNYQDFQRYAPVDISISGDGEATLPALIEAVKSALSNERKSALAMRADGFRKKHADAYEASRQAAALGWDSSPVSTSRLCMDLWQVIKDEDWALVSVGASAAFFSNWPHRLWNIDRHYRFLGFGAGGGVGYGLPAAVGAAMANKALGRFSVNIQCDGDFMYANGALWTAAHHRVPLLTVMHNNRAYGQETMLIQGVANRRERGIENSKIGTEIDNPPINYAKLAEGMGVWSAGPILDPADLAPALKRAVAVVKKGLPALVDVVTQTR